MMKKDRNIWIGKYFSLLYAQRESPKTKADARNLKEKHLRELKYLYIYRDVNYINKHLIPELGSDKPFNVKLSNPKYFNDPFDSRLPREYFSRAYNRAEHIQNLYRLYSMISVPSDPIQDQECWNAYKDSLNIPEDNRGKWGEKLWEISKTYWNDRNSLNKMREYIMNPWKWDNDKLMNDVGIRCFTEDPRSLLMWSHYADHHQGVCLEYDVSQFLLTKDGVHFSTYLHPVRYCDKAEELKIDVLYTPGEKPLSENEKEQQFFRSVLTKAECWNYEKEWRWVALFEPDVVRSNFRTESEFIDYTEKCLPFHLTGIYLGAKISDKLRSDICSAVTYNNEKTPRKRISVKSMHMAEDRFELLVDE